jgi:hypothetical protein
MRAYATISLYLWVCFSALLLYNLHSAPLGSDF